MDVSTKTGLVVMGGGSVVVAKEVDISDMDAKTPVRRIERALKLGQEVFEAASTFRPIVAVIEGYSYGSIFNAPQMGELGAAVRFACLRAGVPFVEVSPSSLKKFATGQGTKVPKDAVMMHVFKKWGFESPTNNVADAYVLARIGLCYAGIVPMATIYERTLLGELKGFR